MEYCFDGPVQEDDAPLTSPAPPWTSDVNTSTGYFDCPSSSVLKRNRNSHFIDHDHDEGDSIEEDGDMDVYHSASGNETKEVFHFSSSNTMTPRVRKKASLAKRRKLCKIGEADEDDMVDYITSPAQRKQTMSNSQRISTQKFLDHTEMLFKDDYQSLLEACVYFRTVLASQTNVSLDIFSEKGITLRIIQLLKSVEDEKLKFELLWSVTNLACGEPHQIQVLFDEGCIVLLLHMMETASQSFAEQAIWALGNVITNHSLATLMLNESRMLEILLWRVGLDEAQRMTDYPTLQGMKHCCWILLSFCRVETSPMLEHKFKAMIIALSVLIQSPDHELLVEACVVVSELCNNSSYFVLPMMELGMISRLTQLASAPCGNALKRLAPLQNEPMPLRRASIKALSSILRICSPFQTSILLLPNHSLLEKMACEMLDDDIDDHYYKRNIIIALKATIYRNAKYADRFMKIVPLMEGLTKMLKGDNDTTFKAGSQLLAALVDNSSKNNIRVSGGNFALSILYKEVEAAIVRMLKIDDREILITALKLLDVVLKNSTHGPLLRQNASAIEQIEDTVGELALSPDASIAQAAKYVDEKYLRV